MYTKPCVCVGKREREILYVKYVLLSSRRANKIRAKSEKENLFAYVFSKSTLYLKVQPNVMQVITVILDFNIVY